MGKSPQKLSILGFCGIFSVFMRLERLIFPAKIIWAIIVADIGHYLTKTITEMVAGNAPDVFRI